MTNAHGVIYGDCALDHDGFAMWDLGPRADGTFEEAQKGLMLGIGGWLGVNGEAIYKTRPWVKFGEGPSVDGKPAYTGQDIRFTRKGETLCTILMAWPGKKAVIGSLGGDAGKVARVELLGHGGALKFSQEAQGLAVAMPPEQPCRYAFALKIEGLKLG